MYSLVVDIKQFKRKRVLRKNVEKCNQIQSDGVRGFVGVVVIVIV